MATDYAALKVEVDALVEAYDADPITWADFAAFCKVAMISAAASDGNVSTYSIAGRSITRSTEAWRDWHKYAQQQANVEDHGGIGQQDVCFRTVVA